MKVMAEKKNQTIQIMRGLAISIVLIRHAIAQVNADCLLYSIEQIIICFHMPVFFVVAGYLFQKKIDKYKKDGRLKFIINKTKHLLVPYLFWTVLLWMGVQVACMISPSILSKVTEIGFAPMSFGNLVYGLLTYQVYYAEHLWFLYVLFLLFIINIFSDKHGATIYSVSIWLLIGFSSQFVELSHIIERVMIWGVFFTFGRFACKYKGTPKSGERSMKRIMIIGTIFILGCISRLIGLNIGVAGKAVSVLMQADKYLVGFSGVYLIYTVSVFLNNRKVGQYIKTIGDYSFDVYLMHNPYFCALSAMVLSKVIGLNSYISVIIAMAIGIVIPMLVSRIIVHKSKVLSMFMIGK